MEWHIFTYGAKAIVSQPKPKFTKKLFGPTRSKNSNKNKDLDSY